MAITFNISAAPSAEDYPDFNNMDDPRVSLLRQVARQLEDLPEFKNPVSKAPTSFNSLVPPSIPDMTIDIWLADDRGYLEDIMMMGDDRVGMCKVADDCRPKSDQCLLEKPSLLLNMRKEVIYDLLDKTYAGLHGDINTAIMAWVCSVAHKARHALDFIEHTGGATPGDVNDAYVMEESGISLLDCITGRGITLSESCNDLADDELIDMMEERVENASRAWVDAMSFDRDSMILNEALFRSLISSQ